MHHSLTHSLTHSHTHKHTQTPTRTHIQTLDRTKSLLSPSLNLHIQTERNLHVTHGARAAFCGPDVRLTRKDRARTARPGSGGRRRSHRASAPRSVLIESAFESLHVQGAFPREGISAIVRS